MVYLKRNINVAGKDAVRVRVSGMAGSLALVRRPRREERAGAQALQGLHGLCVELRIGEGCAALRG